MRPLSAFAFLLLLSCSKTSGPSAPPGTPVTWNLVQKTATVPIPGGNFTPGPDSAVTLSFYPDSLYATTLNGQIVAEGTYSVISDSVYGTFLQLDNLKITGIFRPQAINYISNGQVDHILDNAYVMTQYSDTLALYGEPTPGGYISYFFVRDPIIP